MQKVVRVVPEGYRRRWSRSVTHEVYTFNLDSRKMAVLVAGLPGTAERACSDISVFLDFLKKKDKPGIK